MSNGAAIAEAYYRTRLTSSQAARCAPEGGRPHPWPCHCGACTLFIEVWMDYIDWQLDVEHFEEDLFEPIATISSVTARYTRK